MNAAIWLFLAIGVVGNSMQSLNPTSMTQAFQA